MRAITARHEAWEKRIPEAPSALWDFVARLDLAAQVDLLAHCASLTLNAIRTQGSARETQALKLAEVIGLDMAVYWQPTAEGYFSRITKEQIVEAVRDGAGEDAAQRIAGMKKPEMAKAAEQLLAGTRWLPEVLRTQPAPNEAESAGEAK
jgi:ParB family transcriptional regulator, chromosome partitioning protein